MGKRPSKCYRRIDRPAFTRTKYIKRLPPRPDELRKLSFGDTNKFDFEGKLEIVATKDLQVGDKALGSIRIHIVRDLKVMENKLTGISNFRFELKGVPHHITRMHGLVGIVKAERLAKGMRLGFGRSAFRVARMKKGKVLVEVLIPNEAVAFHVAKNALVKAMKKLPHGFELRHSGISFKNVSAHPSLPRRVKAASTGGRQPT